MTHFAKLGLVGAASVLALGVSFARSDEMSPLRGGYGGCSANEIEMAQSGRGFPECARYATDTTSDDSATASGRGQGGVNSRLGFHSRHTRNGGGHHGHH